MLKNTRRLGLLFLLGMIAAMAAGAEEQVEITSTQAAGYYKNHTKKRVACHDPSVVWDDASKKFYIFGSHLAQAVSANLQDWAIFRAPWGEVLADGTINSGITNAKAFVTSETKSVRIGGEEVTFGNFNTHDWVSAYGEGYNIDGNLWAPDVIYNETMQKWCMYMSLNGPHHNSVIVLLTSDKVDGTYVYQGPVVYTGFKKGSDERISWKKTDLELVLGELNSLPSRYEHPNDWGNYWANGIDPCVFYDEEGRLWMSYGSWSGGIWMLELDETTGLRDYNINYASDYAAKKQGVTQDPYFGKKIAGGYYVSGEASYIEHIGNHYYLFMSYGGLESTGGYQMRVFRSEKPDGPYVDGLGRSAIFSKYVMNYGPNADTRGHLIMGAYAGWGGMKKGELAQGHNSVIAAPDGRSYLVYHTRFDEGTEEHQVRTHQLYLNKEGWLVASPFEYNGGETTDQDIASSEIVGDEQIPGIYHLLVHDYALDYKEREVATPTKIELHADGTVDGAYKGTWSREEGTSYITIRLGNITYQGVVVDEQMDGTTIRAITFTACASNGVHIWGYRMRDDYALAYQVNNQSLPVTNGKIVSTNIDLTYITPIDNVSGRWTSSNPDVFSESGRYNPTGLTENLAIELTYDLTAGVYYWSQTFMITAKADELPTADWQSGAVAYYNFDNNPNYNEIDPTEQATLLKAGVNRLPVLEEDAIRNGKFVHLYFGSNGNESYMSMPNPLYGKEIEEGITLSFWLKRIDDNAWDALWGFYAPDQGARFYMSGSTYIGYNSNTGNWLDMNYPTAYSEMPISVGRWYIVTVTVSKKATSGITIYVDGTKVGNCVYNGILNGAEVARASAFDYEMILSHIANCPEFTLGYGSFWGTPNVCIDDVMIHDRVLSRQEMSALRKMMNRVGDMGEAVVGIEEVVVNAPLGNGLIYDLHGRQVINPLPGIYVRDGKKFIVN